nr:MAG TPA: hypothetical protein [Bacteriophage sp.]
MFTVAITADTLIYRVPFTCATAIFFFRKLPP